MASKQKISPFLRNKHSDIFEDIVVQNGHKS